MDVEIAIRYSDDRPCTVTIARPASGELLYRIITPATPSLKVSLKGYARPAACSQ